ncbi:MAG: hypothetical protein KA343_01970 [Nitrosomonas sp.]|jgi:hypothetical protein|nr:hypothetical protein [Nitrosomonas sp.]
MSELLLDKICRIYHVRHRMTFCYHSREVAAHGTARATVFLMNEAPGPSEAASGIPSFGQQGGNIYHALRKANINWAIAAPSFVWPRSEGKTERHHLKEEFLRLRANHMTCSNAYSRWPRSNSTAKDFLPPRAHDVLSSENIVRIQQEIRTADHGILLVCGRFAYLACTGKEIFHPSLMESEPLSLVELQSINKRLQSVFQEAWYMGHTRRWLTHAEKTVVALHTISKSAAWKLRTGDV